MYGIAGIGLCGLISYAFYRSVFAFIVLSPGILLFIKQKKKELIKRRKLEMTMEFKDAIQAVSAALGAGYSIENAFVESYKDIRKLYGKKAIMVMEFESISRRLSSNETLESILRDIAERSGVEDIRDFTDIFVTAKRSGGDLSAIIRRTAMHISEKIEVKRDIETVMSAKKMEQNIMNIVPLFIILYLGVSSSNFLNILYHNALGIMVMTLCLVTYVIAYFISLKILNIEV